MAKFVNPYSGEIVDKCQVTDELLGDTAFVAIDYREGTDKSGRPGTKVVCAAYAATFPEIDPACKIQPIDPIPLEVFEDDQEGDSEGDQEGKAVDEESDSSAGEGSTDDQGSGEANK